MKIELKSEYANLQGLQQYQAIAEVASTMFGDKKKQRANPDEDVPKTKEEAISMFQDLMSGARNG